MNLTPSVNLNWLNGQTRAQPRSLPSSPELWREMSEKSGIWIGIAGNGNQSVAAEMFFWVFSKLKQLLNAFYRSICLHIQNKYFFLLYFRTI